MNTRLSMDTGEDRVYVLGMIKAVFLKTRLFLLSLSLLLAGLPLSGKAQTLLPETSPKYRVTHQVFDRLTYVFANSRPQPQLEIIARKSNKSQTIAQYQPGNRPLIQLGEEAYDLCTKLGKDSLNALAVLLSHELAHHYEKHDWYYTFGIGQPNGNTSKENIKRFESEADFYGCFYGELAGFATGRIFPKILDLLYERFNLADQLVGYPPKEERKAVYQKKQTEAIQMVAVFKAGQFLYLMKEYESAIQCFDYLVNRFPSREILNNLSAAKLQQALLLYNNHEQPGFVYPVELDVRSRLVAVVRSSPTRFDAKQFQQLLSEARKYGEKAREIDPEYVSAYVNLACIYSLQNNQAAAIGVINELDLSRMTGNAYLMRGIAYYKDKQSGKARQDFEAARQKGGYLAEYNLALYNKLSESFMGNLTGWITGWFAQEASSSSRHSSARSDQERIGGKEAATPLPDQASLLKISEKPYVLMQWQEDPEQLQLGIQAAARRYLVRYAQENYAGKTARGVSQGTSNTVLITQYGEPTYTLTGASSEYWVYQNQKMAFEVDRNGRVNSWLIYARAL